jgi:hypothetical protein
MSLSAANVQLTLVQSILFPTPQLIQGFASDDVTDIEPVEILERRMGVDGILSFGFVWTEREQVIMLQADSASNAFFDILNAQQEAVQDVYVLSGQMVIPAISTKYALINGGFMRHKPTPQVKKILQPKTYRIVWQKVVAGPI